MRNLKLVFWIIILFSLNGFSQGKDVIVWLDNSGSINADEWDDMKVSVDSVITRLLSCNDNRLAVVHYGLNTGGYANADIYIESDFTSNLTTALSYIRRGASSDYAHESLAVIDEALDGDPNSNPLIVSLQNVLTRNPQNELVVYLFTDAFRSGGSGLVNLASPGLNTNAAFQNYTAFKNKHLARFVVTLVVTNPANPVIPAAAAIASVGGLYTGSVETYPADPEIGQSNRSLLATNSFVLTTAELDQITADVCHDCLQTLLLSSPDNNVSATSKQQRSVSIIASNTIDNVANPLDAAIYHAGQFIEMNPGFEAVYDSQYVAEIKDCFETFAYRNANATGPGQFLNSKQLPEIWAGRIKIYPNPSADKITVEYSFDFESITIIAMDGKKMFSQNVYGKTYDIDVSGFARGVYLIVTETDDGKILQTKFIRN